MNGYKWYNIEFTGTLYNLEKANRLRAYLYDRNVKHEVSGCFDGWHFEIYTDAKGAALIDKWLYRYDEKRGITVFTCA